MKTNPMVSRWCCRMVSVLMPVFLMTFILLGLGNGGRAMATDPYTEPADPFEVLSCNPAAACFFSVLQQMWPSQPVGPNQPVVWDQGPETPDLPPDERPPNIILILADDMGFNDVSFYAERDGRTPTFQTPNIDSIAQQGVVFNNAYAASSTCAPSRGAIMTGRYPTRSGYEFNPRQTAMFTPMEMLEQCSENYYKRILDSDLLEDRGGPAVLGMPQSETTLAEKLKDAGYHTAHIGKWHLGGENFMRPEDQGFDESLYLASHLYLPEDSPDVVNAYLTYSSLDMVMWTNQYAAQFNSSPSPDAAYTGGDRFAPDGYLTDYYTDEAIKTIEANKNRPFFLFLSHWGVHSPLQAKKEDYESIPPEITDHRLRVYMAMIKALDRGVGRVVQALEDNGIDNNTLVIFTSDNGGAHYIGLPNINQPYRAWKATFFDGGTHVPFFMKWPKEISAGTIYDKPISHIDVFPTAAVAAGLTVPDDGTLDGVDLGPYVTGADSGTPHDTLFWRSGYYQSVLSRDSGTGEFWKMQVSDRPDKVWLYNLAVDPTEQTNLAGSNPAKVAELQALLDAHNAVQAESLWPMVLETPIPLDKTGEEVILETDEYIYWPM
jgi:arylsulfatase A-like enzyme